MQFAYVILSIVAYRAVKYFSKLSHKRRDLKEVIDHKICVLIFSIDFF
jgi:hypothetical protein